MTRRYLIQRKTTRQRFAYVKLIVGSDADTSKYFTSSHLEESSRVRSIGQNITRLTGAPATSCYLSCSLITVRTLVRLSGGKGECGSMCPRGMLQLSKSTMVRVDPFNNEECQAQNNII